MKKYYKSKIVFIPLLCLDLIFPTLVFIMVLIHKESCLLPLIIMQYILLIMTFLYWRKKLHTEDGISPHNLYQSYFHPIINTAVGEILGYEMKLRTNTCDFEMQSPEISSFVSGEKYRYKFAKYILCNCLKAMKEYSEQFKTKKLFIGYFIIEQLNNKDFCELYTEYGFLFKNVVFEIPADGKLDEHNLKLIQNRIEEINFQIALIVSEIDESSQTRLFKINPDYLIVKESALHYINVDSKKWYQICDLISFAALNNIKVIAHGVETYAEFEYLIHLGFEYIQGYYAAKPQINLVNTISKDLLDKIHEINMRHFYNYSASKLYLTKDEPVLSLTAISMERYTDIIINMEVITIRGTQNMAADLSIIIPNNHTCHLILDHVHLTRNDRPAVIIGDNSNLTIELIGDNYFSYNGIRVPETSNLTILGDGDLNINVVQPSNICIGGTAQQSYGNITLASKGSINIVNTGNISIGIGGGQNPANSLISLKSGIISVATSGNHTLGIGSISGNSRMEINDCRLMIRACGLIAVCLGSIKGSAHIIINAQIDILCDGKNTIGIGVCEKSEGVISVLGGTINIKMIGHSGAGIGSLMGNLNIHIRDGEINIHGEGADYVGIGGQTGFGNIKINNGIISVLLYSAQAVPIGNVQRNVIIDGGNILCDFPNDIIPVNTYLTPLKAHIITEQNDFSYTVETISYSYEYNARRSSRFPYIKVYLPDNIMLPTCP